MGQLLGTIWNDVRFAARVLRKSPLFTGIAVLSLAAGMGANTAIFSLVDQVLLRLLPVKRPEQLALLSIRGINYGSNWGGNAISYPLYEDFRDHNSVFSGMFCRMSYPMALSFNGQTERVDGELVSGTYFPVLGVTAALGRTFTAEEDRVRGGHPVVMLSYDYWKSRFAGDRSIIGKTVTVSGHNMTVVGVADRGFDGVEFGSRTKVFVPMMMKAQITPNWDGLDKRRWRFVNAFGRLRPGVTRTQAAAALQPYYHGILEMEVKQEDFSHASAETRQKFLLNSILTLPGSQGRSYTRSELETPLWVLMASTAVVLLIACANVAGLLVARAASRQREIAIRLAMGAGRWRVIRQLLVESVLLSAAGGLLGLLLATWTNRALLTFAPNAESLNLSSAPDLRVLGFTAVVCLFTGVLFGLLPALQSTRPNLAPTLKEQAGSVVGGSAVKLRKGLVTAQVTLSLLLLVGAGLFLRTLNNLRQLGPGFPTGHLIGFNVDPSLNSYKAPQAQAFYKRLQDELRAIPGVESVGLASVRILEGNEWDSSVTVEGFQARQGEGPEPFMNSIGPGYFATLGVPVIAGRDFRMTDSDRIHHGDKPDDTAPRYVIVNEKFAKKYLAGQNPLGRHVGFGNDPGTKTDMEIIGVVKDIKYTNLRDEIPEQMFVPYVADEHPSGMTVYLRTTVDPAQMFSLVRGKVHDLDANLPVYATRSMEDQLANSLVNERMIATLSVVFGFLATILAAIGLYGVMAYSVERRGREIGIRMALGAVPGDVIWLVMREVLMLSAIGIVAGLAGSLALTRYVQSQLYGVHGNDWTTMGAATVGLAIVASAAGLVPALRASHADPMHALRYE